MKAAVFLFAVASSIVSAFAVPLEQPPVRSFSVVNAADSPELNPFFNPFLAEASESLISVDEWLPMQYAASLSKMMQNISPDNYKGAIAASPAGRDPREQPNYWYHWIRDAALVMDVVRKLYERSNGTEAAKYEQMFWDYATFERRLQQLPAQGGIGEPKYYLNGNIYNEPWGRPQNDGPALRASVLIRFSNIYLARGGDLNRVRNTFYDGKFPSNTIVKVDLEYVVAKYNEPCFDLWEETMALNFYTRMVQRRSLVEGAEFARLMGDNGAATYYAQEAKNMEKQIDSHWDSNRNYILESLGRVGGIDWKSSNMDTAAVLAALHTDANDGFYDASSPRILAHAQKLIETFGSLYPVNSASSAQDKILGTAIGRYPEDRFDGYSLTLGNPWFLATNAIAELHFRLASHVKTAEVTPLTSESASFFARVLGVSREALPKSFIRDTNATQDLIFALQTTGDDFLRRVQYHSPRPSAKNAFSLWEQFNRQSGFMQSARDLTWSFASLLTATWERERSLTSVTSVVPAFVETEVLGG